MLSPLLMARLRAYLVLVLAMVLFAGCAISRSPITGKKRLYGYSWSQEMQIGKESDPQIVAQFGLYDDARLSDYVTRIGEKVLAESHLRRPETDPEYRIPFTFRVLDSPIINAFALPGGYVYVTRGLLSHLNNEAQLAVVLGHEITHVAARHASQRAASQQLGTLGLLGAAIGGQLLLGGNTAESVLNIGGTAAQLLFLRYGRDDERESDQNGVDYSGMAGYNPSEGAAFFHSLKRIGEQQDGGAIPSFLSTHPDPGEREQTINRISERWEQAGATVVDQQGYYAMLGNVVLGEDPRQGFVESGVFYHPGLKFSFPVPSGYRVINQPTQVAMVEPNQKAVMLFSVAPDATSAQAAAAQLTAQEGVTTVNSGAATVSGNRAYYVLADAQSDGGEVRLLSYYIEYGGAVFTFLGYAAKASFSTYQSTFERSMRGFDRVTDQRILTIQPTRLRLVTASRSGAFRTFLPTTLPAQFTPEGMAILNQVELDTPIQRGQKLKLP